MLQYKNLNIIHLHGKFDQSFGSLILPKNKGNGLWPYAPMSFDS